MTKLFDADKRYTKLGVLGLAAGRATSRSLFDDDNGQSVIVGRSITPLRSSPNLPNYQCFSFSAWVYINCGYKVGRGCGFLMPEATTT